jgi:hypothetical protein
VNAAVLSWRKRETEGKVEWKTLRYYNEIKLSYEGMSGTGSMKHALDNRHGQDYCRGATQVCMIVELFFGPHHCGCADHRNYQ